jgi:8-oxo-dGTP pyrophosphatase MutT (NUDIX family)
VDVATSGADEVVAGILVRDGQVLLCHRTAGRKWYPDVWDLPGGHVEAEETVLGALVGELEEELGVVIKEPSGQEFSRLVTNEVDLRIWVIQEWIGTPVNASPNEHDHVEWFSSGAVAGLRLAHESYISLIAEAL